MLGVQRLGSLAGRGQEQPGLCEAWAGEPSAACLPWLIHIQPSHPTTICFCPGAAAALLCWGQAMLQCCNQASMQRPLACRHAAAAVSEAPVLQPLTPLGEFIKQVGQVPDKEALAVYLRRMREHGWDVSPTIRKALQCGASIMPEVGPLCVCCADTLNPKPCQWLYRVKHVCWPPASV